MEARSRIVHVFSNLWQRGVNEVKLFLYLLGTQGREIYSTMTFEAPGLERNLKQIMDAFDKHCNPKKNETVERYKFFWRFQNPGESLEKFIIDLKLLATTYFDQISQNNCIRCIFFAN